MISMQGVSSALIARNASWVRKQANTLARRMPANVQRADLIQAGLIAVAQAALGFRWEGDRDTAEARDAFLRYARMRVKGAMMDELRQMDHLGREQRRKCTVLQIARERWRSLNGASPRLSELSGVTGLGIDEIASLDLAAWSAQAESLVQDSNPDDHPVAQQPATERDEVEARVDTAIVLRRLETFFATLPERDRQVIDAYLGVGMSPVELAGSLNVTVSRVSQLYKNVCGRVARHFGHAERRSLDRPGAAATVAFDELVVSREAQLARSTAAPPWSELVEAALTTPDERFSPRVPAVAAVRIPADRITRKFKEPT
ncbi:sigma-70 family RNA polymerase sigma factor [Aquincola sp. S2]|uniref:Sigma-70 family RNA polymerase sigma factor n=1 Tax=Pseudaquabacterium terrae TaxID=2732868 RepID=A0ABX2EAD2_9BURK|nr:sigma-70 family RNA polymerase sigma factor [Aquabacterium terrae]NRF65707.1 sigma-70 family RNA polymerase sigma factor [Aquabacterium terrae]